MGAVEGTGVAEWSRTRSMAVGRRRAVVSDRHVLPLLLPLVLVLVLVLVLPALLPLLLPLLVVVVVVVLLLPPLPKEGGLRLRRASRLGPLREGVEAPLTRPSAAEASVSSLSRWWSPSYTS